MLHNSFAINGVGHLSIAGLDSVELSKEYGTPTYYMDEDAIRSACRTYRSAFAKYFGDGSEVIYAGKAFCTREMYRLIAREGLRADCVSPGELYTAYTAGFPMERVYFHGNNKTDEDLRRAISLNTGYIVVDSLDELDALESEAEKAGICQSILLRITPGIDPHTHKKIITGNIDSKFGSAVATGAAEAMTVAALKKKHIKLEGFHCHVGSQIFDIAPFVDAAVIMLNFIADMKLKYAYEAAALNLGGGFGVRYIQSDPVIDYDSNIKNIAVAIDETCVALGIRRPNIFMEPGRSIVAAAGATLYTVGSVKKIPNFRNYVSIDGGMPDNPRYALYQSQYTVVNATRAGLPLDFCCTVAGRCCESGDLIAEGVRIAEPKRGDILAVLCTGAYNYSMASNYNRILRPPVVFISNRRSRVVVKRESFDDLMARDI